MGEDIQVGEDIQGGGVDNQVEEISRVEEEITKWGKIFRVGRR